MKKYTLRCLIQHMKMFLTLMVIILLSSFLSFKMAEFSCWLKQCDCLSLLNRETIITRSEYKSSPRLSHHKLEEDSCVSVKRDIASNLAAVDIELNCDMLSGLNTKSDNQCLREEASAFQTFQEHQVFKRLQLNPDQYFSQLKTTAFKKLTKYEIETPLAFAIVVHNQIGQLEALLASLFRPQNSYCLYLDKKTSAEFKEGVQNMVNHYKAKFPKANIFLVDDPKPIYWGDQSLLNSDLTCMNELLTTSLALKRTNPETKLWKFYMNLAGTVMPQRSVLEMARVLNDFESQDLESHDSIESTEKQRSFFEKRYLYRYFMPNEKDSESEQPATTQKSKNFENKEDYLHRYAVSPRTNMETKDPPPFNLTIFKGYREAIISRETAMFMTTSQVAIDLHTWLQDAAMAEEFFFATIARISQKHYRETGNIVQDKSESFDSQHGLCNRLSLWSFKHPKCKGSFKRWICNMGLGDLPTAYMETQCFFLNKFDLKVDPLPVSCLHQHWTQ